MNQTQFPKLRVAARIIHMYVRSPLSGEFSAFWYKLRGSLTCGQTGVDVMDQRESEAWQR